MKLTDAHLRSLPATHLGDITDDATPGLTLRCSPGVRAWAVRYRVAGTQKRTTIGPYPLISLSAARDKARAIKAGLLINGTDPQVEKAAQHAAQQAKEGRLLDSIARRYFEACQLGTHRLSSAKPKRFTSIAIEDSAYQNYLRPDFGKREAATIRRAEIQATIDDIAASRPGMARTVRDVIRQILAYAMKLDLVDRNAGSGIAAPAGNPRERTLTDAEIRALWAEFSTLGIAGTVLQFALATGQRGGEVGGMEWAEVDFAKAIWTIPPGRHKQGRGHVVPLSSLALRLLDEARGDANGSPDSPVFPGLDGARSRRSNTAVMRRACARLKLARATPHDLRRTLATRLAEAGHGLTVGHILGHQEGGVTRRHYDRYSYLREKADALEAWAGLLDGILNPPPPADAGNVVTMRRKRAA